MLKLYGGTRTRATIVRWYLEELKLPYESISVDISAGEHRKPEFLAINPMGKLPALEDGDYKIWESGAILLYLADKYDKTAENAQIRSIFAQWVIFANATLALGIFLDDRRDQELPKLLPSIEQILQQQPFLCGDILTVADIAVASYLNYGCTLLSLDYKDYPVIISYLDRLSQREAFQKAFGTYPI
ncbi:glutathione S-transferase family protein [Chroococcus sp. FPU101]|uniref:glutathione S-transferase family protein n=1 Tax=Chroococcus sp. FPU101 TaxID=1974212 RepID=UPI001A8F3942|nr:glutathione S-transferase family protein [Chroococcus sp. FPU101]GFE68811.1 glutathione S-transferase domain-containing protein [Chroococcus sp. FPU101]